MEPVGARKQRRVPIVQRQEDLLVIAPRVVARFDEQKSVLAGVLAAVQGPCRQRHGGCRSKRKAGAGRGVKVCPRGAPFRSCRNARRTLFHGTIHLRGQKESVVMKPVRAFSVWVGHIDGDRPTLFEAQQWTGDLAVIRNGP